MTNSHVLLLKSVVGVPPGGVMCGVQLLRNVQMTEEQGTTVLFSALLWSNLLNKENLTN